MRRLKLLLLGFLILLLFFISSFLYLVLPINANAQMERFVVPLNTNQDQIVNDLKLKGFIRSADFFSLWVDINYLAQPIAPAAYLVSRQMNFFDLAKVLYSAPYQEWTIIVPGLRLEQVAQKLEKKFSWDKKTVLDFLTNGKEGYMFPDTYLINPKASGKEVDQQMINNFNEKFDSQLQKDLLKENVKNDTAIKIASLIERESGGDSDKALISGIIWNRLNIGMKLQIDATIQYVLASLDNWTQNPLSNELINWWPNVGSEDLQLESPYNTYLYQGLPPTPISSPSLASIKASIHPVDTDCLFYLHDNLKQIHCAKTYEEHLANIKKYLD